MESCSTNLCWIEVIPCSIFVYLTVWGCCDWYSKIYANLKCRCFASDLFKLIYVLKEFKNKEAFKKRLNSFLKVERACSCLFTTAFAWRELVLGGSWGTGPGVSVHRGPLLPGAGGAASRVQSFWNPVHFPALAAWLRVFVEHVSRSVSRLQQAGVGWEQLPGAMWSCLRGSQPWLSMALA